MSSHDTTTPIALIRAIENGDETAIHALCDLAESVGNDRPRGGPKESPTISIEEICRILVDREFTETYHLRNIAIEWLLAKFSIPLEAYKQLDNQA